MLGPVFRMFAQADESLERVHGGLGVGLTLARHLVELHGGTIEARSEGIGHGSEFIVRLPRVQDVAAACSAPEDEALHARFRQGAHRRVTGGGASVHCVVTGTRLASQPRRGVY